MGGHVTLMLSGSVDGLASIVMSLHAQRVSIAKVRLGVAASALGCRTAGLLGIRPPAASCRAGSRWSAPCG